MEGFTTIGTLDLKKDAIRCAALNKLDPSYVIVSVISVMPFPLTLPESRECRRVLGSTGVTVKLPDRRPSHNSLKVICVHREAKKTSSRTKNAFVNTQHV